MAKSFACPSLYVQEPGATATLGATLSKLGLEGPVLVLAGRSAGQQLGGRLAATFSAAGLAHSLIIFSGECSDSEIARVAAAGHALGARTVLGMGGGKAVDTAKAAAEKLGLPVVVCPTIASTDAPTSALSVIYTDDGVCLRSDWHRTSPALVLVDTTVILEAPRRFLLAGMGDALSTFFEARACERSGAPNCRGGTTTRAAQALAELCWKTLIADGSAALASHDAKEPSPAFERIVEANTLLSGLGFESAGLAAAHAIHNGLTVAPETHHFLHGEKVAFGTLVQLMLEEAPEAELHAVLDFCTAVGLPVTLAEIGLTDLDDTQLQKIASRAVIPQESIHHEPFPVTRESAVAAIRDADAAGRGWRKRA